MIEVHRGHMPELDGVRGLACILILILHVVLWPLPVDPESWLNLARFRVQPFLNSGVDLFFILSGFLISGALMDSKGSPNFFRSFWARRAARIFPVYYLMICVSIIARTVYNAHPTPVLNELTKLSIPEGYYAIFSQNIFFALTGAEGNRILAVTWSLAIEEQFYFVFPILVYFVPRRWLAVIAMAVIISTPVVRAITVDNLGWWGGYVLTICKMDGLMLGVLLAMIVRNETSLSIVRRWQTALNWLAVALIALQLGDFWGFAKGLPENRVISLVLLCVQYPLMNLTMACLMLNIFTRKTGPFRWLLKTRALTSLGLGSYGAYMYHQPINHALWRWLYNVPPPQAMTLERAYVPVLVLTLTSVVSFLSYRYFEMPIRTWVKEKARPKAVYGHGYGSVGTV